MKNLFSYFFVLLLFAVFVFVSCQKGVNLPDSPNPISISELTKSLSNSDSEGEIENWVMVHRNQVQNISRKELASMPDVYHRPIFRVLSANQQVAIWHDKLTQALEIVKTEDEKSHIRSLYNFLSSDIYAHPERIDQYRSTFLQAWEDKAIKMFGMEDAGNLVSSLENYSKSINNENNAKVEQVVYCNCSQVSNWCAPFVKCKATSCVYSSSGMGCGTAWLYSCNGRCGGK